MSHRELDVNNAVCDEDFGTHLKGTQSYMWTQGEHEQPESKARELRYVQHSESEPGDSNGCMETRTEKLKYSWVLNEAPFSKS